MDSNAASWTIYTASKHFGLHHKRLRAILAAAGRLPVGHGALSANRVVIQGADVEGFLSGVAEMMSLAKAREYLNIPRPHDRLLLEAGYLVPFIVGGTETLKDHGLRKSDLDLFLARLKAKATAPTSSSLQSIPAAAKRADCSALEVIDLLLNGDLSDVAIDPINRGYLSILVNPGEISPLVRLPDEGLLSLRNVEEIARWSTKVVKALVDQRLLPYQVVRNPVKRSPQRVVNPVDLADFRNRYVALFTLAEELSIHFQDLKRQLDDYGVRPAVGFEAVPATFYLRDSLAAFTPARA
ncbi:MAG: hypothetical protein DI533_21700 [Cereibacter sphaeroides]|uniref:Uncharacterized protein n=1 Tax=Cereibacter sphaeroides TaxID=1063 RepID=A0A2W5RZ35_CERSP|nr:MAG: hypothetical protein DI533_21700 [Cereibacter sphaeroides]